LNRRSRIIQAAQELFLSRGFRGVTVDDIAGSVGMSKRTLYEEFASKDDLVCAVFDRFLLQVEEGVQKLLEHRRSEDPLGLMRATVDFLSRLFRRTEQPFFRDLARHYPHLWDRVEELRSRNLRFLEGMLEEGQRRGYVRSDLHLPVVVAAITSAVQAVASPSFLAQHPYSLDQVLASLFDFFRHGMEEPRSEPGEHHRTE